MYSGGCQGQGWGSNGEILFNGYRISVLQDEELWRWILGMVCTIWMHLTPLNYTVKILKIINIKNQFSSVCVYIFGFLFCFTNLFGYPVSKTVTCNHSCNQVILALQHFFLFQHWFGFSRSFASPYKFYNKFLNLFKDILIEIPLNY